MADLTIFQLPEQTGKTDNDVLAIVDSGDTTTSKIKVSTLLSGLDMIKKSNGTDSFVSRNNDTTDTTGNVQFVLGGSNCDITSATANNGIIGGADCNLTSGGISGIVFAQNSDLSGSVSSVYGGDNNDVTGSYSQIFGGEYNLVTVSYSQIVSGVRNEVRSQNCGVIMGRENIIAANTSNYNFMIGGYDNDILATGGGYNTNIGGTLNKISGSTSSLIINGNTGSISGGTSSSIISGVNNIIRTSNYSAIVGGDNNDILDTSTNSTINGGASNIISGSTQGFIGGGQDNKISGSTHSSIIGGKNNIVRSSSHYSGLVNGEGNTISGATHAAIIGGSNNTNNHNYSVILGGTGLTTNTTQEVVVRHFKASGQTSSGFYDIGTGTTATTINFNHGNNQSLFLTGDTALTFTNARVGATYNLLVGSDSNHNITSFSATGYTIKILEIPGSGNSYISLKGVAQGDMIKVEVFDSYIVVYQQTALSTYAYP